MTVIITEAEMVELENSTIKQIEEQLYALLVA